MLHHLVIADVRLRGLRGRPVGPPLGVAVVEPLAAAEELEARLLADALEADAHDPELRVEDRGGIGFVELEDVLHGEDPVDVADPALELGEERDQRARVLHRELGAGVDPRGGAQDAAALGHRRGEPPVLLDAGLLAPEDAVCEPELGLLEIHFVRVQVARADPCIQRAVDLDAIQPPPRPRRRGAAG